MATVFYDVKKVFDILNHEILSDKMENAGIRGIWLELARSYLSRRKIAVDVAGKLFNFKNLNGIDVTQCSVLGPLKFFIYINDLLQSLQGNISLTMLFADDTAISVKARDSTTLIGNLIVPATSVNRCFQ